MVLICDNTMGLTTTTCSYSLTIGTEFSDSLSEGMSIDTTVEAELQLQFWGLFSGGLGVSESTGYDWRHYVRHHQEPAGHGHGAGRGPPWPGAGHRAGQG